MTGQEWLECTEVALLIASAENAGSERKLRLFAAACCRRIAHLLVDERSKTALSVLERYAEGKSDAQELAACLVQARMAVDALSDSLRDAEGIVRANAACCAASAVQCAVNLNLKPNIQPDYTSSATRSVATWSRAALRSDHSQEMADTDKMASLAQACLLREIYGNPFQPVALNAVWLTWNDGTVPRIATTIYDKRAFDHLPILADALEEAGCDNQDILDHCRSPGPHVRGCWVVDLILGKD